MPMIAGRIPSLRLAGLAACTALAACTGFDGIGKPPDFSSATTGAEYDAMANIPFPAELQRRRAVDAASLWDTGRGSLLGDPRARQPGDILTVVIEIDDKARISNSSARSRSGQEELRIPDLFGLPQRLGGLLPEGATLDPAVRTSSSSESSGDGSVRRQEQLTLRIAATVVSVLPNGVLQIQGSQEVRVNFELRELLVTGYVRPEDITRQNEITYDRIASARISYGGRGQISEVQQPRIGQQVADRVLPF